MEFLYHCFIFIIAFLLGDTIGVNRCKAKFLQALLNKEISKQKENP